MYSVRRTRARVESDSVACDESAPVRDADRSSRASYARVTVIERKRRFRRGRPRAAVRVIRPTDREGTCTRRAHVVGSHPIFFISEHDVSGRSRREHDRVPRGDKRRVDASPRAVFSRANGGGGSVSTMHRFRDRPRTTVTTKRTDCSRRRDLRRKQRRLRVKPPTSRERGLVDFFHVVFVVFD